MLPIAKANGRCSTDSTKSGVTETLPSSDDRAVKERDNLAVITDHRILARSLSFSRYDKTGC